MIDKSAIKQLPASIGIYLFKKGEENIYIGKSLNIRQRVHDHYERARFDAKERLIIENSDTVEFIICSSELHALVLESQLIQQFKPAYNVIWKDDKSYLYIKIPIKDTFPRITLVRREQDGKSMYFGPFSSTRDVRFLLRSIRKVVPFCTQKQPSKKACFYSKIGLCNPCPGGIHAITDTTIIDQYKKKYLSQIKKVVSILQGKAETILAELRNEIVHKSSEEKFEEAIKLRNKLLSLEQLIHLRSFEQFEYTKAYDPEKALEKLSLLLKSISDHSGEIGRIECYDISNLMQNEATASMVVATDGILDKAEYKKFKIKQTGVSDFKMLTETITRRFKNEWPMPDLIVIDGGTPQVTTINSVLKRLEIQIPLIGIAKHPDRIVVLTGGVVKTHKFSFHNEGFKLIQQLRDESHRFAKKYHTLLRGNKFKLIVKK